MLIGEDLCLHMSRTVEVALDEALTSPESGDRFTDRAVVELRDLVARPRDLQPAAAAAEGRFDGDGKAVVVDEGEHLVDAVDGVGGAGCERCTDVLRDVAGLDFFTESLDRRRRGAGPHQPRIDHCSRGSRGLRGGALSPGARVGAPTTGG